MIVNVPVIEAAIYRTASNPGACARLELLHLALLVELRARVHERLDPHREGGRTRFGLRITQRPVSLVQSVKEAVRVVPAVLPSERE
jgi:hypothetical protein